jgi:hypothetical protein
MACANVADNPAEPKVGWLPGVWVASPEVGSPSGRYERSLSFGSEGSFVSEVRSYGIYGWQPAGELSGYTRTEGTYGVEIEGNRLEFLPLRIVSWDRFYGPNSPETVREPYPGETVFDNARYELSGDILTLRFTIYPADAAEPAELIFTRAD